MVFNVTPDEVRVRLAVTATHVWPNKERHKDGFRAAPRCQARPHDVALARRQAAVPEILIRHP